MSPLSNQKFTLSMIEKLDRSTLNGIRGAYYSKNKKVCTVDKSIKVEDLTPVQIATMLKELGCSVVDDQIGSALKETSTNDTLKKREIMLQKREITLQNRENALKNREAKFTGKESEFLEQTRAFDQKVREVEEEFYEKEEYLNNRATQLRRQDAEQKQRKSELDEQERKLQQKAASLNQKKNALDERKKELQQRATELDERERKFQQKAAALNQRKQALDNRESKLQQKESSLNHNTPNGDSESTNKNSPLFQKEDCSQQVVGIELRQRESRRLLSDDPERSRLIQEAGKEICNKWLQVKQGLLNTEGGRQTEKLIYQFVQKFIKTNYPYFGKHVGELILYDLQKRREEMNGVSSQD